MLGIRCAAYVAVLYLFVWLANSLGIPRCFGGEKPPSDLVLLRSFAIPPVAGDIPQIAHEVGFSKNGQLMACFCNLLRFPGSGKVYLWDIKTGKRVQVGLSEWKGVILRPNGPIEFPCYFTAEPYARLCFRTTEGLEVQDDLTTPTKRLIPLKLLDGAAEIRQQGVYFSTDDKYLAAVRKDDKSVNVWNTRDGERVKRFALPETNTSAVRSLAFDATNRYLAAGLDTPEYRVGAPGVVIVWDLKTGQEVLHTKGEYRVFQVAFCANGDLICGESGRRLDDPGRVTIRKGREFDDTRTIHTPAGIWSAAIVPHVGLLTGDTRGQVLLWDIETGKLLAVTRENGFAVVSLAVGHTGELVASGDWDGRARLWKIVGAHRKRGHH
ncbi:MAG: hypothetical protein A2V70_17540 [Planctomycetes bacterium RBG_13_63_9]|nr:MAG: hypothetical protein A2V70_17540 [Planctomycetes bacterium RBG_13_63_9]